MNYSEMRPDRPKKRRGVPVPAAKENRLVDPPRAHDPGPRPLSDRQHALKNRRPDPSGASFAPATPPNTPPGVRHRAPRPASARAARRTVLRNRKRRNGWRIALRIATVLLVAECVFAALTSPRLWVRTVTIEGNQTVTTRRLAERLALKDRTNLLLLPMGRLTRAVETEPVVAYAELHRRLPGTLAVQVRERAPWASVQVGENIFLTIDRSLVPFRKRATPEPGLPLIVCDGLTISSVKLGKQIQTVGLNQANICLDWAQARVDFPMDSVRIDPVGKICLNRKGGAVVQLGSALELREKLNTLGLLLEKRDDLRSGDFTYVNLVASDTPAIMTRTASASLPSPSASGSTSVQVENP